MPNWWERKKRQLGNLGRQTANVLEDTANVATLGTFETLEDAVSGRGFTNPLANMARSGENLYRPIDEAVFDPIEKGIEDGISDIGDDIKEWGDDLIQTPEENLEEMQGTLDEQAKIGKEKWDQYLGGIDDFGMNQIQADADQSRYLTDYVPQNYGQYGGLDYQREGGPAPQYQQWTGESLGQDPGYQFRMDQGLEALERQAGAKGMTLGSGLMKEQMKFAQGLASEESDRAFGRHMGEYGAQRGAFDADRGFGLGEWATRNPQLYGQFTGERGFQYGQNVDDYNIRRQRRQDDWGQQTFFPQYSKGVQAMRNPLGYTGQQANLAQTAAQGQMMQPTWLDYAGLGVDAVSAGADIYSGFSSKKRIN